MRFSRRGRWSGLPLPSPGDLPKPGMEPESPTLQADALQTELRGKPLWQAPAAPGFSWCVITAPRLNPSQSVAGGGYSASSGVVLTVTDADASVALFLRSALQSAP